jgi:hypothetical protein
MSKFSSKPLAPKFPAAEAGMTRLISYPAMPAGDDVVAVTAYDSKDWTASGSWWTTTGDLFVGKATMGEMVNEILVKSKGKKIGRLAIFDHGSYNNFEMGEESVGVPSFVDNHTHRETLAKLKGQFAEGGYIYLGHCYIGLGVDVMQCLADLVGVPVYGNTGLVRPWVNAAHGRLICVEPAGKHTWDPQRITPHGKWHAK